MGACIVPDYALEPVCFFALLAMNFALDFGEKLGRALYYLMH